MYLKEFAGCDAWPRTEGKHFQHVNKNLILATYWTKSCGPRLTAGWNGDDRYAARNHAKRWRKSDESSQI